MNVYPLQLEQSGHFTHKIVLTSDDLTETTANTAQTIAILTVDAGDIVSDCAVILNDGFEDASDNALNSTTLIVGDDGSTNRYLTSTELNENGSEVDYKAGTQTAGYAYLAANTVDAIFGSMTDKSLSNVDVGEVTILLKVVKAASI